MREAQWRRTHVCGLFAHEGSIRLGVGTKGTLATWASSFADLPPPSPPTARRPPCPTLDSKKRSISLRNLEDLENLTFVGKPMMQLVEAQILVNRRH